MGKEERKSNTSSWSPGCKCDWGLASTLSVTVHGRKPAPRDRLPRVFGVWSRPFWPSSTWVRGVLRESGLRVGRVERHVRAEMVCTEAVGACALPTVGSVCTARQCQVVTKHTCWITRPLAPCQISLLLLFGLRIFLFIFLLLLGLFLLV